MFTIGERINGMFKDVRQAIADKDPGPIVDLARRQTEAGAAYLDVLVAVVTYATAHPVTTPAGWNV